MRALLDDVSVLHEKDQVGVHDRGQAVRNHETGPALHQGAHGLADLDFRAGVHAGGRLVQNNDGGIAEEHPRDGEELPLSYGNILLIVA